MTLKMFSRFNSSSSSSSSQAKFSLLANGEAIGVGENYKDIFSMSELKQSLRAYKQASFMALPWYPAPTALILFLEHHDFMSAEVHSNQAKIVSDFCNEVFAKNARLWNSSDPPLSVELLRNTWVHFLVDNNLNSFKTAASKSYTQPASAGIAPPYPAKSYSKFNKSSIYNSDICVRFNSEICPSQKLPSCILPSKSSAKPIRLRHVCLKCKGNHPQSRHR